MARPPRFVIPGHPMHIIQRGNNKTRTFYCNKDYLFYLDCLGKACEKNDCRIHAYVLMSNHVHLLATPMQFDSLSRVMQNVGRRFVRYINKNHGRTGTLWEGRFKASLIDTEHYLLSCYRYIEFNPVRAGLVSHPRDYPWSSYQAHAEGKEDLLIQDHPLYLALGTSAESRRHAYQEMLNAYLGEEFVDKIRAATNKGMVLGDDPFCEEIGRRLERRTTPLPRGGDRRSKSFRKDKETRIKRL